MDDRALLPEEGRQWRLICDIRRPGAENMAVDESLLVSHASGDSPPVLRFYGWDPPALTIGYFQSHAREVDENGCRRHGFDWVRRPTGGRAVLHQHELTYSVVVSESLLRGSVLQTYQILSMSLLNGLKRLGLDAELTEGRPPTRRERQLSSAACFDSATPHELAVDGRKVVGSAQVRQRGVLLQHGSMPLRLDRCAVVDCLNLGSETLRSRVLRTLETKAAGLTEVSSQPIDCASLARAVQAGFEETLGVSFIRDDLTAEEKSRVEELIRDKYGTDDWNRAR